MESKRGFTLIELLVVIAIIGILSSIVLVALRDARNKAKDARIVADLSQIRSLAELLYDGDYDDVSMGTLTDTCVYSGGNADIDKIAGDICNQKGSLVINKTASPADAYCAYSALNVSGYYCVDSTGRAGFTENNPGTETACPSDAH